MPFQVCPDCAGSGRDDSTAYAITSDELDEYAGPDYDDRREYVASLANLTQPCSFCAGQRVVTDERFSEWHEEEEYRALTAMEAYYDRYC